ncbi:hypothetical protein RI129_006152 [Pyrocoelia pectoralis]|uniref:Peptidase S1 domain-containing protein n=1 Tax=Pyrocoelia pectoralis TaxID=417401 RepID=A0AAN7ZI43_9COLE
MFKVVLVAVFLALAVEAKPRRPILDGRIVGGEDVTIDQFPYQISLQYYRSHICGGSIISTNRILTAAHCTDESPAPYLSIRYGTSIQNEGGHEVDLLEVKQHHQYDAYYNDFDVSVLILKSNIVESETARIVKLVPRLTLEGGRSAVVTGWGDLQSGGSSPSQLQAVEVQEIDRKQCSIAYEAEGRPITDRMICFEDAGKDACQGDSGGPLVSDDVQVGVVSWGWGCADYRYPGVYANVEKLRGFIDENL